eukprot:CAMPEP_0119537222 /NCGR_PEP_ID=MMETSP1344-20130328/49939_1 /TAXON_ID=236787 /ORGANISM="Florenciella parvula, Strain CCMP2471" /LENGTH=132 /DNA_ID=CAMNT_0007579641 /DNA_START=12 /DNA_END=411 /DNA_ORIENTATION=+
MAAPAKAAPIPSKLLKRITVGVTLSISSKAVANWESIASISECDCPVLSAPVSKRGRSNSSTAVRDPQANAGSTKPVIIVRTNCIRAYATSEIETNAMMWVSHTVPPGKQGTVHSRGGMMAAFHFRAVRMAM